MLVRGNRYRTQLHNDPLPDGPLTGRQRAMADAVRHCWHLSDFASKAKKLETVVRVCTIAHDTPESVADKIVLDGLARAEKQIADFRMLYAMHGAACFMPQAVPVDAPRERQPTRYGALIEVLRHVSGIGHVLVRAGDSAVSLDASGGYVIDKPAAKSLAADPATQTEES